LTSGDLQSAQADWHQVDLQWTGHGPGSVPRSILTLPNFTPIGASMRVSDCKPNTKFLECACCTKPAAYPLCDFYKICRTLRPFDDALDVKIRTDLLKGFCSYGGFNLRGSGCVDFLARSAKLPEGLYIFICFSVTVSLKHQLLILIMQLPLSQLKLARV